MIPLHPNIAASLPLQTNKEAFERACARIEATPLRHRPHGLDDLRSAHRRAVELAEQLARLIKAMEA